MKLPKLIRMHSSEGRTVDNKDQVVINTVTSFMFDTGGSVNFEIKEGDSVETIITTLIRTIELLKGLIPKEEKVSKVLHESYCNVVNNMKSKECNCNSVAIQPKE